MWIDTHCHLDAAEYAVDRQAVIAEAVAVGVAKIVIPAVQRTNFEAVQQLARALPGGAYALGIHPLYVPQMQDGDLVVLRQLAEQTLSDPRFIGIGEIGLDFFVPTLCDDAMRERQEHVFCEQLKIARDLELPVLLHVRRAQDAILKYLRRIPVNGGIAHAFNGSFQQAEAFITRGFRLGLGGAMTYPRALQIRRLAAELPEDAIVLETDGPDIPPAWLAQAGQTKRNAPAQLPRIAQTLAELRQLSLSEVARLTTGNAHRALPRLQQSAR